MIDWLLILTLLAIVGLHWLVELLPGRNPAMWCAELSLEPARVTAQPNRPHRPDRSER